MNNIKAPEHVCIDCPNYRKSVTEKDTWHMCDGDFVYCMRKYGQECEVYSDHLKEIEEELEW